VDDRSPLDLEAEHGVTMDDMYDRGSRMDVMRRRILNAIWEASAVI